MRQHVHLSLPNGRRLHTSELFPDSYMNQTLISSRLSQPLGIQYYVFEGVSCLPPSLTRTGANCSLGGMPSYVVKATNVAQIQLAVNFARNLNLRLIVKNKGHDFKAKSSGGGALSIWTNGLQGIQYLGSKYTHAASGYKGPAFKIGSGVEALAIYTAADNLGLHVVGGNTRVSAAPIFSHYTCNEAVVGI